jgi:hypothetical protein
VSSSVHGTALAEKSAKGQELAAAWMPDSDVDSNADADTGDKSGGEHTGAERDLYLGEHSAAERAVLCIVVSARQARGDSASDVQTMVGEAAADETEGSSVLSEQSAVRADC